MILALYGAGAMGREEKFIADQEGSFNEVVFIDDVRTEELSGCRVYSFRDFKNRFSPDEVRFVIAMGEPRFRRENFDKWSFILPVSSLGGVIMPSVIGYIAEKAGIASGISSIAVALVAELICIILICSRKSGSE